LYTNLSTNYKDFLTTDGEACINFAKELAHKGENLTHALKDLSALFHQISIAQILNTSEVSDDIKALSAPFGLC
jgi:DNA polymerase-3 subunit gamma/tau